MWIVGIDSATLLLSVGFSNIFLTVVLSMFILFDLLILNYLGPILFLYGFTKILIRGSFRFQELVIKAGGKILGEFGKLISTYNGWGMRIEFVSEDETSSRPTIEVRNQTDDT